jgi:hypothetical protein
VNLRGGIYQWPLLPELQFTIIYNDGGNGTSGLNVNFIHSQRYRCRNMVNQIFAGSSAQYNPAISRVNSIFHNNWNLAFDAVAPVKRTVFLMCDGEITLEQ